MGIEDALGITTVEKAVAWAQADSMWPDTFGLACCAIEMMSIVSSRYDISRFGMERFSSSPRQADLLIVSGRVTHKMSLPPAAGLRPDAGAEMGDRDGRVRELRRDVQQLHRAARGRQDRPRRRPRAGLPAASRGVDGGHRAAAREDQGRRAARLPDPRRGQNDGGVSDDGGTKACRGSSRRSMPMARRPSSSTPPASSRRARTCATSRDSTSSPM